MNELISFAVVLAINLFLLSMIVAGALGLFLRLVAKTSPRLCYVVAACAFLLAVTIPLAVTLDTPAGPGPHPGTFAGTTPGPVVKERAAISNIGDPDGDEMYNPVDEIAAYVAGSAVGGIFLAVWILGTLLLLFRESVGLLHLNRSRRGWEPATTSERESLGGPGDVPIYFCRDQSPGTSGFLFPVIVLPRDIPGEISLEAKRLIVQHEAAHVRWRDPLVNIVLRLVRNLFWVSPALWVMTRLIENEREAAADAAAIASLSNERDLRTTVLIYADTLVAMAKDTFGRQERNQPMIGLKGSQSKLEDRVRRLLSPYRTTRLNVACTVLTCVMTLAVIKVIPVAGLPGKTSERSGSLAIAADDPDQQALIDPASTTVETKDLAKRSRPARSASPRINRSYGFAKGPTATFAPWVRSGNNYRRSGQGCEAPTRSSNTT